MRPSPGQISRVAETLTRRLLEADVLELDGKEDELRRRIVAAFTKNFDDEEAIERQATAAAEKLIRQGAPGVRRDELDLRKVEQLMKQRIAKEKGFPL